MDERELAQLLTDVESERVERKASLSDKDRIREAICAFANDLGNYRRPGVIFVGANDDGSCSNLPITDQLLLTLSQMKDDGNIMPFPSMSVRKATIAGCELAVVIVQPADAPPVRFSGRTWIRIGPRRGTATAEEERRLAEKRRAGDLPFDIRPIRAASVADLDLDFFTRIYLKAALPADVLAANKRSPEQQLLSKRMIAPGEPPVPTVLGLLTIGKDCRDFLPGAYIQFLRIDGTKVTDPITDQKEIDGQLTELIQRLDDILQAHISTASDFTSGPLEIRQPDFPLVALQQLTRNAVLHRSYEGTNAPIRITWFRDRIEILNPGGPFGQVTRENFGQPGIADYRNPHLAEAMKDLGYVQRFGVGIQIARDELEKNGNPPPEFKVEPSYILATVKARA